MAQIINFDYDLQINQDSFLMHQKVASNNSNFIFQADSAHQNGLKMDFDYLRHPKSIFSINTQIDLNQHTIFFQESNFQDDEPFYQNQSDNFQRENNFFEPVYQFSQQIQHLHFQQNELEPQWLKADSGEYKPISYKKKSVQKDNCNDETKNILKNYIKAIFAFSLRNEAKVAKIAKQYDVKGDLFQFLRKQRRIKCYTIQRLKSLWNDDDFGCIMRVLSCHFFRHDCWSYIFSSKIVKKSVHLKYRGRLMDGLKDPGAFRNIK